MSVEVSSLGIDQLSVDERLELIEHIWNTLPQEVSPNDLAPEHIAELQKRRTSAKAHPGVGKPWREVLDKLGDKS